MISIDEINKLKEENAKLNAIIDGYQPRLQALKDEKDKYYQQTLDDEIQINELYEENERLKEEIKEVKKYQYEQEYLEKEIETAKVNLDIGKEEARHYLHEAYKFQKCLQEIKKIAEAPKPFIDFSETKTATEVGYDYAAICNEFELRLHKVLELITKAESEV